MQERDRHFFHPILNQYLKKSIVTSMDWTKPVDIGKSGFRKKRRFKMRKPLFLHYQDSNRRNQIIFFIPVTYSREKVLKWDVDARNQVSRYGEQGVGIWKKTVGTNSSCSALSNEEKSYQSNKIIGFCSKTHIRLVVCQLRFWWNKFG